MYRPSSIAPVLQLGESSGAAKDGVKRCRLGIKCELDFPLVHATYQ